MKWLQLRGPSPPSPLPRRTGYIGGVLLYLLGFWTQRLICNNNSNQRFSENIRKTAATTNSASSATAPPPLPFYPTYHNNNNSSNSNNLTSTSSSSSFFPHRLWFATFAEKSPKTAATSLEQELAALASTRNTLVQGHPSFLSCNAPKTGCTAWLFFYLFVNTGQAFADATTNPSRIHSGHALQAIRGFSTETMNQTQLVRVHRDLDRIVFVRNPYVRFLSSYQDWRARNRQQYNLTFTEFAVAWDHGQLPGNSGDHIAPVSTSCLVGVLNYTILRIEEQALWFHDFIRHYGLQDLLQNYTSQSKGDTILFESGLQPDARLADWASSIMGATEWPARHVFNSSHHRGSSRRIYEYYTPQIAEIVTRRFSKDFLFFGYPLWEGSRGTFRYV